MKEWIKESKLLWYGISTLILAGLIYTADFGQFASSVIRADAGYVFLALLAGLSVFVIFGLIWHRFFVKLGIEENLFNSYRLFMAGNFMNSVTPLGNLGGEPFMAYVVSENTDTDYEKALSSVVSADLINLAPILVYILAGVLYLVFFGNPIPMISNLLLVTLVLVLGVGAVVYILWSRKESLAEAVLDLLELISRKTGKGEGIRESARERLSLLEKTFKEAGEDRVFVAWTALIAHLMPLAQFLCLYLVMLGLGIEPTLTGIYFIVMLSGLTYFSPTPGGSGAYEAAFSGLMTVFYPGVGLGTAVAAAVLFRLTTFWPGILIGYISLLSLRGGRR